MGRLLPRIFSPGASPTDGLSQAQREAIVDQLHFCMCADQELLPSKSGEIAHEVSGFNWDPAVDFEAFAEKSKDRARAAVADPGMRKAVLASVAERLATTEMMTRGLELCVNVFKVDGEFAPEERTVFHEIKRAFGWPD